MVKLDGQWVRKIILMTPKQHEWLRKKAYEQEISQAMIIRELIDEVMAKASRNS